MSGESKSGRQPRRAAPPQPPPPPPPPTHSPPPAPRLQDREIRFDVNVNALATRKGEYIIDSIDGIEDTKGNNGENGAMLVSNLRILWIAGKKKTTNLSIGFNTVLSITIRKAKSKLRGTTQALYVERALRCWCCCY